MLSTKFIFIKGWLHCLTSEPWRLVMAQIQFSLIKKMKIRRPEHLLYPTNLRPISSNFCLTLPQPPKSGRHMCITPNLAWMKVTNAKMSKSKNLLKIIIFAEIDIGSLSYLQHFGYFMDNYFNRRASPNITSVSCVKCC